MGSKKQLLNTLNQSLNSNCSELDIITKVVELIGLQATFNEHYYLGNPKDMKNEFKSSIQQEYRDESNADAPVKRKLGCTSVSTLSAYLLKSKGLNVSYLLENLDTGTSDQYVSFKQLANNAMRQNDTIHICLIIHTRDFGPLKFDLQPYLLDIKLHNYPKNLLLREISDSNTISALDSNIVKSSFERNGFYFDGIPLPLFNEFSNSTYQKQIEQFIDILSIGDTYIGCSETHKILKDLISRSSTSKNINANNFKISRCSIAIPLPNSPYSKTIHSFFVICNEFATPTHPLVYIFSHNNNHLVNISVDEFLFLCTEKSMKIYDTTLDSLSKQFKISSNSNSINDVQQNLSDRYFEDTDYYEI